MVSGSSEEWEMPIYMVVEDVKAHRTKKGRFVTEGNEKADELANAGAMLDEGIVAEARATTVQQEREEVCAALQYAATFSLHGGRIERM